MPLRFVTKNIHARLDYPVALMLMAAPLALGLGESTPAARWLSVATGLAAITLTLFTDHALGVVRMLPYRVHVLVDGLVGVAFLIAPVALGFRGIDAWYYWANAAAVLTVVGLSAPTPAGAPISGPRHARA